MHPTCQALAARRRAIDVAARADSEQSAPLPTPDERQRAKTGSESA